MLSTVYDMFVQLIMHITVQVLVCTYGFENHSTDAIGRLELLGYAAFGTFAAAHSPKWVHFVEGA